MKRALTTLFNKELLCLWGWDEQYGASTCERQVLFAQKLSAGERGRLAEMVLALRELLDPIIPIPPCLGVLGSFDEVGGVL